MTRANPQDLQLVRVNRYEELPQGIDRSSLCLFLHESLKPFNDTLPDIEAGLDYAFSPEAGKGGFVVLALDDKRPVGALVMLDTGMKGYVPAHLLLFVAVDPSMRGKGLGRRIVERALADCEGPVKLHVEYDNPAKRLYERIGFSSKYAEMRFER